MKKQPPLLKIIPWVILAFLALCFFSWPKKDSPSLKINHHTFTLEIADSPSKRSRGLSDRKSLPENQGMLFIFEKAGLYPFWMNKMNFSLDIIYIHENQITEIFPNLPPPQASQPPKNVFPQKPANLVLELNGGTAQKLNLKPGDLVDLSL